MAWHLLIHPSCTLPSYEDLLKVQAETGSIYLCKDTCKTMWEYNAERYSWTEVRKVKEDKVDKLFRTDRVIEVEGYRKIIEEEQRIKLREEQRRQLEARWEAEKQERLRNPFPVYTDYEEPLPPWWHVNRWFN